ncbi:hypothetical protein [Dietzia sp. ANT_WB102]|uniref:hypothetical protein n=1 Tax=Dietzia sp. ANT_WB102 TaxID=2597345 RepID=UPI0011F06F2F|nr:hypothetical protein [Dietzia sp. ANT_WB102]KAA0916459.1 hypothetical protein FQ137_14650 [Dietzia sp. ANT_WB102]
MDSLVVLRPRMTVDRYSSVEKPDWTLPPERITVPFLVSVQPLSSSEDGPERPAVTTTWRLLTPPGRDLDLRSVDRVEVNGEMTMSVVGDVARYRAGAPGRVHHVRAALERVAG